MLFSFIRDAFTRRDTHTSTRTHDADDARGDVTGVEDQDTPEGAAARAALDAADEIIDDPRTFALRNGVRPFALVQTRHGNYVEVMSWPWRAQSPSRLAVNARTTLGDPTSLVTFDATHDLDLSTVVRCEDRTRSSDDLVRRHNAALRKAAVSVDTTARVVRDLDDRNGWRVEWHGVLCTPSWNSKGAAQCYLDMLRNGTRRPELPRPRGMDDTAWASQ